VKIPLAAGALVLVVGIVLSVASHLGRGATFAIAMPAVQ
jgi:hypothetical protein